jgi:hypothetical protein
VTYAYTGNTYVMLNHLPCTCLQNLHASCSFLTVFPVWAYCRTRAGISRADQYYASYPAGTELLTDTAKVWIWTHWNLLPLPMPTKLCKSK